MLQDHELYFLREMLYAAIFIRSDSGPLPESIVDRPELSKYYRNWGRMGDIAFVADVRDNLAGAAWCRLFDEPDPGYGFISDTIPEISMAVKPEYRNIGVGSWLLDCLCDEARKQHIHFLSLNVDKLNPALNLYLRKGFEAVKEGGTSITMKKAL